MMNRAEAWDESTAVRSFSWYHGVTIARLPSDEQVILARGNGEEGIYRTDEDRQRFLARVAELPERFGTEIHAFVLMDNDYPLLVRCRRSDVSETLRWLQIPYAIGFNGAHRRRGHEFHGRFKSVLIRDESALDAVVRWGATYDARAFSRAPHLAVRF